MDKEIKDENLNNISDTPEERHGLTADKIAHLLEHLGDEVIRDMLDSAGLDYDDPLGENGSNKDEVENDKDESPEEEYVGRRFRREPEELAEGSEDPDEEASEKSDEADTPVESAADVDEPESPETVEAMEVVEPAEAVEKDVAPESAETGAEKTEPMKEVASEEVSDEPDTAAEAELSSDSSKEGTVDESGNSEEKAAALSNDADADSKPADEGTKQKDKKPQKKSSRKRRHRKVPLVRRLLFVFVLIGVLLLPVAIHFIYISATLNSDDPIQYSEHVDEVSCTDGVLKVNNVEASVPTDGTEEYSISYSWSEEDEQYPSVPHAITAVYKGSEGERKYSISLYRNETIPAADIAEGRNADNWFDEWESSEDEETVQAPLQFETIKGFYISPKANPDDPDAPPEYNNYSFYFAVQDANGVSIYVLEGDCTDAQYSKDFAGIMETSIKSIKINMPDSEQS